MDLFLAIENSIEQSMSDFQISHFVVNDHITPYRKIKQVVIEIRSRMENKASAMLDAEELQIKLEQLEFELTQSTPSSFAARLSEVELERLKFQRNRKQHQLALIDRELAVFNELLTTLAADLGGPENAIRQIKSKDFRDAGEAEYWEKRLARNVLADLFATGTIGKGLFETLTTLPEGTAERIIAAAVVQNTDLHLTLEQKRDEHLIAIN